MHAILLPLCLAGTALAAPPVILPDYTSEPGPYLGSLADSPGGVSRFSIHGSLTDKGRLVLVLAQRVRDLTDAGEAVRPDTLHRAEFRCAAVFVKRMVFRQGLRIVRRDLYRLEGETLKSKVSLLGPEREGGSLRLLLHGKDGKVVEAVELGKRPRPAPPE